MVVVSANVSGIHILLKSAELHITCTVNRCKIHVYISGYFLFLKDQIFLSFYFLWILKFFNKDENALVFVRILTFSFNLLPYHTFHVNCYCKKLFRLKDSIFIWLNNELVHLRSILFCIFFVNEIIQYLLIKQTFKYV